MTTNLQEFLSILMLVSATTGFVAGFRYMIATWERSAEEEVKRRQPEWDAIRAEQAKRNK